MITAYADWASTRNPAAEWALEELDAGIWWTGDSMEMLEIVLAIVDRVGDDRLALEFVGAGPLEDLLGGHAAVMRRAEEAARSNPRLRVALANVTGVKLKRPGYETIYRLVHDAAE